MLHKLQTCFLKGIYDISSEQDVFPYIKDVTGKTLSQQFNIYRGSIFGGLKKALAETYPVTKSLVGDDFFNMMLGQFIKLYPCDVQDLNEYGEELSAYIADLPQARSVPYLSDIAKLEWLYNVASNSKIQDSNLDKISKFSPEQQASIKLHLPVGSALMQSKYPIDRIWAIHDTEEALCIDKSKDDLFFIIFKDSAGCKINQLTQTQFIYLNKINEQVVFVDVCASMLSVYDEETINRLFNEFIYNGWIQHCTV